ncbi:MAG: peptidylprolyl isomerase [Endomicrobium sp.]|jgi:parvulin-like peptidyl-prolyl isomerase|uniref:peptidylprolyl isomerase n=1 Tax=Candidatus Endomicrobiellum cubanum TaxID=3242325 RepID=UPI00282F6AE6|nr:peptidylprolyl isomerase [Endomicrobium sp.]
MKSQLLLTSIVCVGFFLCSCKKDSPVVVQVGNEKITEAKLNERLAATPAEYQKYASTAIGKKQFIDAILKETVVIEAAKKAGVEKREDYKNALSAFETEQKKQLSDYKNGLLIESYIKEIHEVIEPNDEEIKKYYDDHRDLFDQPVAYTVRHILVADLQSAQTAIERLSNGESFEKVAKEVSQDSGSAANGGLIGPFKKGDLVPEFEEAVVNLKTNEMSGIVETPYGYHIVFKVSEQKLPAIPFDQAKETIKKMLEKEKFDNWFSKQKESLKVKVNYDLPLASTEEEKSK